MKSQNSFSRRSFIKRAAIAGAAPLILPSSLWAAETKPNDKITMGFIGMGTQNRGLLSGFLPRKETRVLAVCDVDTNRRENAKKMVQEAYGEDSIYKGCATYNDYRELIANKDIDTICIATPDHWHALIAIEALNAGKDVYCEKPMAHTVLEGRAMVEATRRNNRILQVGSMQRSYREFRTACELVRNGVLGRIIVAEVGIYGGPGIFCNLPAETEEPGLDWDLWLGPAPKRPYHSSLSPRGVHTNYPDWRKYREYGSGFIGDWGAHHFDIVQWALGHDDSGPVEFVPPKDREANVGASYRYENGVEVIHVPGGGITFIGENGRIFVDRGTFKLWLGNNGGKLKTDDRGECDQMLQEYLPANATRLYKSDDHLVDFLNCVRSRQKPCCDVEIGHRSSTICNLVGLSYYHNQVLKWNPKKEKFVDGTGDRKWLAPDFRGPWKLA